MELIRKKNTETKIVFPLVTSGGTDYYSTSAWTALTNSSKILYSWKDSDTPVSASITNNPTQIASTGLWYLTLTSGETNLDSGTDNYIVVKLKASQIQEQTVLVHLTDYQFAQVADSSNRIIASSVVNPINVSGYSNFPSVNVSAVTDGALVSADFGTDYYNRISQLQPTTVAVSAYSNFPQVTVSANLDKINYSISGTKKLLDNLNDINGASVTATSVTNPVSVSAYTNFPSVNVSAVTDGALVSADFGTDYYNRISQLQPTTVSVSAYSNFPQVQVSGINSSVITSATLAANAIGATQIAANAIGATQIASNAIVAGKIASNAITDAKINAGAITSAKFAAGAITSATFAEGALVSADFGTDYYNRVQLALATEANATSNRNTIQSDIANVQTNVNGISGDIGVIITDTNEIQSKLPVGNIASEDDVASILQNTRFAAALPSIVIVPVSGAQIYQIKTFFYNTSGTMEDPDSNELTVEASSVRDVAVIREFYDDISGSTPATTSTTFGSDYYKMIRLSTGVYQTFYKFDSSAFNLPDQILFDFALNENSNELHYGRSTTLFDQEPGTSQLADNDINKNVIAKAFRIYDADNNIGAIVEGSIEDSINDVINASRDSILTSGNAGWQTADVSSLATTSQLASSAAQIVVEINQNEVKIDNVQTTVNAISSDTDNISSLATTSQLASSAAQIVVEINQNEVKIDSIIVNTDLIPNISAAVDLQMTNSHGAGSWEASAVNIGEVTVSAYNNFPKVAVSAIDNGIEISATVTIDYDQIKDASVSAIDEKFTFNGTDVNAFSTNMISGFNIGEVTVSAYNNFPQVTVSANLDKFEYTLTSADKQSLVDDILNAPIDTGFDLVNTLKVLLAKLDGNINITEGATEYTINFLDKTGAVLTTHVINKATSNRTV